MQLETLIKVLNDSWSKETCYPKIKEEWSTTNSPLGQCAITCLIVNDYFDFDIYKCKVNGISHYFNVKDNQILDLTKEQFNSVNIEYENVQKATRENILLNNDTLNRYLLLKDKVNRSINGDNNE